MAYGEELAQRVRNLLGSKAGFAEKKMFGGVCFLLRGNMVCGVLNDDLIVRVGPEKYLQILQLPDTRQFDITGKAMKGWVMVAATGLKTEKGLSSWLDHGVAFAMSLPPK